MKKKEESIKRHNAVSPGDEWIFIVIFVVLLVFFVNLLLVPQTEDETNAILEKLTIDSESSNHELAFLDGNIIDQARLESMSKLSYDSIKQELGVEKEFYIYLEDSMGRLIPIDSKACLGSSKATVNGIKCS